MKSFRRITLYSLLLVSVVTVTGCASLGPAYTRVDKLPENKGLVYIYRPSSFIGGGLSYIVNAGDIPVTTLYSGGYYPYFSDPGEKEFWARTESKSSVTLDIRAGQTYYIKGEVGVGFLVGRPHLMVVAPEVAEKEIADCKLIAAPAK
jgi:hypothetical protein